MTLTIEPHKLPGINPSFHEARKYLSVRKHNGEEILASHGSCKQDGCGYSSAWTSNGARDRGMWLHRALEVRKARVIYFTELFGENHPNVGRLFEETADNNSHFFHPWQKLVQMHYREMLGDKVELPEYDYFKEYSNGKAAMDTARFVIEAGLV